MAVIHRQPVIALGTAAALLLASGASVADPVVPPGEEPAAPSEASIQSEKSPNAAVPSPNDLAFDPLFDDEGEVYDPLEPTNRVIYCFNQGVSTVFFDPVTRGYRFVVPGLVRRALQRALHNLNAPIFIVNNLLQLRPVAALETLGAFAMNLSFGLGGLVETASGAGLALVPADFGQTLAGIGVGSGPYIIMPLLGPTTLRDGFGFVVDRAFHPLTYVLAFPVQLVGYGGIGVVRRDEIYDELKALEGSSIDSYAVLRSAYTQARASEIEKMRAREDADPAPQRSL